MDQDNPKTRESTFLDESAKQASSFHDNKEKSHPPTSSRRRAAAAGHVSFAPSVLADRPSTSRVTVVEERGVYTDALGRRVAQSAVISGDDGSSRGIAGDHIPPCAVAAGKERISRSAAGKHEKGHVEFAVDNEAKSTKASDLSDASIGNREEQIQYDSLTTNLGLLKCGYRYQTTVPIHAEHDDGEHAEKEDVQCEIVEIGESLDPDLEVEAVPNACVGGAGGTSNAATDPNITGTCTRDQIQLRIAARRPGKYQSSFSIITEQTTTTMNGGGSNGTALQKQQHIVSVRVKATLLGKDQGKPQLKSNIIKLGKLVGYDSEEETEWQGFPESDDGSVGDDSSL